MRAAVPICGTGLGSLAVWDCRKAGRDWRYAGTRPASGTLEPVSDPVLQHNIARSEQKSESYTRTRLNLAFCAPRIQRAILDGTLPSHRTTDGILRLKLPDDWSAKINAPALQAGPASQKPHGVLDPQRLRAHSSRCSGELAVSAGQGAMQATGTAPEFGERSEGDQP